MKVEMVQCRPWSGVNSQMVLTSTVLIGGLVSQTAGHLVKDRGSRPPLVVGDNDIDHDLLRFPALSLRQILDHQQEGFHANDATTAQGRPPFQQC